MVHELRHLTGKEQTIDYVGLEKEINQLYEACSKARIKLCLPDEFLADTYIDSHVDYEPVELNSADHINLSGSESPSERQEMIYSLSRQKKAYKNTFSRWSSEEESDLQSLKSQSVSVDDIARKLNRTKSAITSRLRKLRQMTLNNKVQKIAHETKMDGTGG